MATQADVAGLAELLLRLREADSQRRVFGSDHHGYRIGPVLSDAELLAFETAHRVTLPEDHRCFLATVGNGGAGPFYGLEPLGSGEHDLSRPFPLTQATDQLSEQERGELPEREDLGGILELCHQGCDSYSYLVVNGSTYGTIWSGGIWEARQALGRPVRYLEATDIPAQLEIDERDVVVKVNPWPFI